MREVRTNRTLEEIKNFVGFLDKSYIGYDYFIWISLIPRESRPIVSGDVEDTVVRTKDGYSILLQVEDGTNQNIVTDWEQYEFLKLLEEFLGI